MLVHRYLSSQIRQAVRNAQTSRDLPFFDIPKVRVEHPRQISHGDYATPAPLELARLARMTPVEIGNVVVRHLGQLDCVEQTEVSPKDSTLWTLLSGW